MSTQPYTAPDLKSDDTKHDPALEPIAGNVAEHSDDAAVERPAPTESAKPALGRERGSEETQAKTSEECGEEPEQACLDDALDDSFPASDPPSQTSRGTARRFARDEKEGS